MSGNIQVTFVPIKNPQKLQSFVTIKLEANFHDKMYMCIM